MEVITWIAENFIGLFNASAESLMGLITGILLSFSCCSRQCTP